MSVDFIFPVLYVKILHPPKILQKNDFTVINILEIINFLLTSERWD